LILGGAYLKGSGYFGARVSSWQPENKNMPIIFGVYILFNEKDGSIAGVFETEAIAKARTGGKTSVALKYLAEKKLLEISILGMGNQAESHALAIASILKVKKYHFWTRDIKKHKDFIQEIQKKTGVECDFDKPEIIAGNCDVLINTTDTDKPLFDSSVIKDDTLVIGINHSPDVREYDAKLFKRVGKVFVDFKQNTDAGTLQDAIKSKYLKENEIIELAEVVKKNSFRKKKGEMIYFQSGGVSIEDLAGAIAVIKGK